MAVPPIEEDRRADRLQQLTVISPYKQKLGLTLRGRVRPACCVINLTHEFAVVCASDYHDSPDDPMATSVAIFRFSAASKSAIT